MPGAAGTAPEPGGWSLGPKRAGNGPQRPPQQLHPPAVPQFPHAGDAERAAGDTAGSPYGINPERGARRPLCCEAGGLAARLCAPHPPHILPDLACSHPNLGRYLGAFYPPACSSRAGLPPGTPSTPSYAPAPPVPAPGGHPAPRVLGRAPQNPPQRQLVPPIPSGCAAWCFTVMQQGGDTVPKGGVSKPHNGPTHSLGSWGSCQHEQTPSPPPHEPEGFIQRANTPAPPATAPVGQQGPLTRCSPSGLIYPKNRLIYPISRAD